MTGSPMRAGRRSATSSVRWSSASRWLLIASGSYSGLTQARQRPPNRAEICHIVQHVLSSLRGLPQEWGSGRYRHWHWRVWIVGWVEFLSVAGTERAIVDGTTDLQQEVGP